jgi:VWFA-related protein
MLKRALLSVSLSGLTLLLGGVLGWAPLSAQKKTNPDQDALQHEVTVTVKLVQVYVTDPKGNPSRDLEMSDFVLYDNGKLQTITGFEKHFLAGPEGSPEAPPEAKVGESKPWPARDAASLMNRKFIFLFDFGANGLEGIMKSRKAALEFMDTQVQPGDEVAILSYVSIRRMTLHEYFTSDHEKIRATIRKIKGVPGVVEGWMSFASLGHSIMGTELDAGPTLDPGALARAGTTGDASESVGSTSRGTVAVVRGGGLASGSPEGRMFTDAMSELAKAFRHIPGQKNIILFSQGYGRGGFQPNRPEAHQFVQMAKELASANAPVFPVNTTTGVVGRVAAGVFPDGSLEYLSRMTGGKYLGDIDYPAQVARALQEATSNYYVLAYSVASSWDGKFHEIRVQVKKQGYRVHAQGGYFNPRPFNTLSPVEKHLQLLDLTLGEKPYFEQHLNFPMAALPFSDKKEANTLLLSEIPVQRVRETVGDNTEFISLVFDENRTIVDSKRVEINWETIKGARIFQYSAAALAPGRYDCRVVIRNLGNGKAAVGACSVYIPEAPAAAVLTLAEAQACQMRIFPPLLLVPGKFGQYLNVSAQDKSGAAKEISLSQVFPFPPREFAPLIGGLEQGVKSLCAAVSCAWTEAQVTAAQPEVQFSAWIIPEGSEQKSDLTVGVSSAADQDNVRFFLLELTLPELKPGSYTLHVRAEDTANKASSETSTELSILPPAGSEK